MQQCKANLTPQTEAYGWTHLLPIMRLNHMPSSMLPMCRWLWECRTQDLLSLLCVYTCATASRKEPLLFVGQSNALRPPP